ncbi:hypothetical protein VitviT2T_002760 [Vitis vinifera]|uniref:Uncharacterized protein n=1 Tax=Vitis vinifera TaxID=29760 RepID=A0ABY9BK67_VITVI|nr:hypothetical protein VitviT2T_002760 [Vitis vinifera]
MGLGGLNNRQIYKVDLCGPSPPWQVIIEEYNACGSAGRHHMNQSLRRSGSIDSDLVQGSNQSITVSAQGCQQALDGNTSLGAL